MMIEKIMPPDKNPSPVWVMPVLVLPLLLLTGLALPSHGAQWTTETIDDPRFYMDIPLNSAGRRLTLAADDTITLLYGNGPGDLLVAQKKPSADAWRFFPVFQGELGTSAWSPSLALDEQARPHVAYIQHYVNDKSSIKSAVLEDDTWRVETVYSQAGTECLLGIGVAVDNLANKHILFASSTPDGPCRELKYARKNAGQWSIETIEINSYASIRPKGIAVDSSATPHLVYTFYNGSKYELRHAVKMNGSWQITSVDAIDVFSPASISFDTNGRPHLAYTSEYPDHELKYAIFNGTEWQPQNIGVSGIDVSLLLDGNSMPHISFRNENGLFYAYFDGTQWQTTCLDPEPPTGVFSSIAMDSQSRIHISYADKNDATRHAFFDGSGWQNEIVDIWRTVSGQSIALDSWGRPHISYSHGSSEIQYARHDGQSWHIETVATGPFGESYTTPTSLAVDILNHPHISYYDWSGADLKYAHNDGSGWRIHTVDSEGDVGLSSSIALDSVSSPHFSYLDLTQNRIKYAYLNNDAWVTESIVPPYSPISLFSETNLLLDHLSQPHLIVRNENSLYYWSKSDHAWQAELVASDVNLSASPGFALDRQSRPCVTYQDANDYNLRYGCRDVAGWHFATIDESEGGRGQAASLVFDRLARPHISYSEWAQNGYALRHAYHAENTWQIDTVKFPSSPYTIDSAISRTGQLHISYIEGGSEYALEHASALFPQPKFPWQVLFPGLIQNGKK